MAGGEGLRCRPLTATRPKPMLPVGGKPLLEILIGQLVKAGCTTIFLNVRYLRRRIEEYFGDGAVGATIHYLREPKPYGTAGGLSLIPRDLRPDESFLVLNADILTPIDFAAFRAFHVAEGNLLTLVGREHRVTIPYGYPLLRGDVVADFREKPTFTYRVNSGIYCLEPSLLDWPHGPADMPDLIRHACAIGRVGLYPLDVPYHEIGTVESYQKAEAFHKEHMRCAP